MKNPLQNFRPQDADRFHASYEKGDPDACWLWQGVVPAKGYGRFNLGKIPGSGGSKRYVVAAHRVAYVLAKGEFPWGLHILHRCHNPRCVNPAHLYPGTNQDNIADRVRANRSNINAVCYYCGK